MAENNCWSLRRTDAMLLICLTCNLFQMFPRGFFPEREGREVFLEAFLWWTKWKFIKKIFKTFPACRQRPRQKKKLIRSQSSHSCYSPFSWQGNKKHEEALSFKLLRCERSTIVKKLKTWWFYHFHPSLFVKWPRLPLQSFERGHITSCWASGWRWSGALRCLKNGQPRCIEYHSIIPGWYNICI